MLDRTKPVIPDRPAGAVPPRPGGVLLRLLWLIRALPMIVGQRLSSSLWRRIVVLNLLGLIMLLVGFLWLTQTRAGLIDARVQSLLIQGEIIAGAIASSATVEGGGISIDPDKLLQLQAGESTTAQEDPGSAPSFSIDPERVAPVLRRLVTPTGTRARLYDTDSTLILDTRDFFARGDIGKLDLPPAEESRTIFERGWSIFKRQLGKLDVQIIDEQAGAKAQPEVASALQGLTKTVVRVTTEGQTIVFAAIPIQRFRAVRGALLLSTQEGDIDEVIARERLSVLFVFSLASLVTLILSMLLAGTIAGPMRRLADAAERVRVGIKSREQIPDFTHRRDEIGLLSGSLREMTQALYKRIEAIESFAADVAHELKNPLTSLRSAVETLPLARTETARARLLEVIQHDVKRLDRLISDISDASRLDAELARADAGPVDMIRLLQTVTGIADGLQGKRQAPVALSVSGAPEQRGTAFFVTGHDSRLAQVFSNLIDNARSFSPPGATVRLACARQDAKILVTVDDDGPGIPPHALARIFERFYTDRPDHGFGQNSGLGLSISRQIVEAHAGRIWAENRPLAQGASASGKAYAGARICVELPATA